MTLFGEIFFLAINHQQNTINKAVEMMKAAGINADSQKIKENGYIEYIVRIPTENN